MMTLHTAYTGEEEMVELGQERQSEKAKLDDHFHEY